MSPSGPSINMEHPRYWKKPLCCNCRNRRNLQVCRDSRKGGRETIEECEGYEKILPWR